MKSICMMRDIYKAISLFEAEFEKVHGLSLNEAMVLCALQEADEEGLISTAISERTEMTASHTSKVIRSVEDKGLIERAVGEVDKRQMHFSLTIAGKEKLQRLLCKDVAIPELLKPVFEKMLVPVS